PDIEISEETAEEAAEELAAQEVCGEIPEETAEETAEEFTEEPAEEIAEEAAEEFAEEAPEETEETEEEEPVVLTREEMGYDIVFNTTISCLITNAALTKSQANKLASILHDAYARAIKPVHGTLDGDTVFVLATGKQQVNFDAFAALATDVMQYAIIDGAMSAESAYGIPAARDM
ncbi:MAG: P1 family peptidase, partial [Mogibacterium sp.]|nr:P1 family peptidase [Mogibacterium sp.]